MKSLLLIILLIPLLINGQIEKVISKYPAHVGDIVFDEKQDDPDFKKCIDRDSGIQYYNDSKGFQYKGEKIAVEEKIKSLNLQSNKSSNGYITIRFLVNCEGKTGMFRMQQMNKDYKEKIFDKGLSDTLLSFTRNLQGWIPKQIKGKKVDYYQYLTYKIDNGKVSEILP
jgi:hypothetical protein